MLKDSRVGGTVCPACENETAIECGAREETLSVRGVPIKIEAEVQRCTSCGEIFATVDQEERNFQKAYRQYRKARRMVQPEDIRQLRERYGLGQRAFSRLLGWGEITLHRYESGGLQDEAHDHTLRLLQAPANFKEVFERNKARLSDGLREKVEKRLVDIIPQSQHMEMRRRMESLFGDARLDILSGFRRFDADRMENLVLHFCRSMSAVTKTKLNKLLWYTDFLAFKKHACSLTGLPYLRCAYGPVPQHNDYCLAHFVAEGSLVGEEIDYGNGILGEVFTTADVPDLSRFSEGENAVVERVLGLFRDMSAKQISECSHREEAYKQTTQGELITYEWASRLSIDL
jgi:putative zinc finger/helix-turn-helix YgiT family protein